MQLHLKNYIRRFIRICIVLHSATYCDGLRTDVERAFLILDEDDQLIIGLSVYGGYNSKEIGKMLRLNPNTVRSRRKRALEKMSWLLKE